MGKSVLIIEDEKIMRVSLADALKAEGYTVYAVDSGADGLGALKKGDFSLVITDVRLPDMSGIAILKEAKQEMPDRPIVVMTAYGSIEDAVEAMRHGAFDYITKPFSMEEMLLAIERALAVSTITEENIRLKKELSSCFCFPNIIGESPAMRRVFSLLTKVSQTDSTVLLLGDSGTGKELIASTIHYQSGRRERPLIRVNCAALPENLIESELFGYEKGAFTGATATKPGRFELADSGTIFLDEIGDLPLLIQTKILRVLEERTFERLGGTRTLHVDVRVIAATNKKLSQEVKNGNFREDLFYRLNVIPIELPTLRQRQADIPHLVDHFVRKMNDRFGARIRFSPAAVTALARYSFPGNVRELINIIERCIALAGEEAVIQPHDLPPHVVNRPADKTPISTLARIVAETEKAHITTMLTFTGGNRTQTAELLGISRKNLWEKMAAYELDG